MERFHIVKEFWVEKLAVYPDICEITTLSLSLSLSHTHRRQKELVAPMLFEVAQTANTDLLFKIFENGDDINPTVRISSLHR